MSPCDCRSYPPSLSIKQPVSQHGFKTLNVDAESGVMNMAGSLAPSISPIVFGVLVQRGLWIAPFFISAGVLLTGALIWTFLIDPERSVVEDTVTLASA